MHLQGYPKYYIKNGKRRAVFHTAEVRDLVALGWKPEAKVVAVQEKVEKPIEVKAVAKEEVATAEVVEAELVDNEPVPQQEVQTKRLPDFEFMTKVELLQYAMDRGVDLPNNVLKAELVKACRELENV